MQVLTRTPSRILGLLLPALLLLAATNAGAVVGVPADMPPGVPAGYQFRPLADTVEPSSFKTSYDDRVFGVATALNNNGEIIGYWLNNAGTYHAHAILFGTNPLMSARDSTDFIGLSGSDVTCRLFFSVVLCPLEFPFGIRVTPPVAPATTSTGVTAFLSTPAGSEAIAGSLPFTLYPGNFVEENRNGVVATTQLTPTGQYGVLVNGNAQAALTDVPWLIAINDLAEPLVLGYDGVDGDCVIYGPSCAPPLPEGCEEDAAHDSHGGSIGVGHEQHGNGNGYGHDDCAKALAHATSGTSATNGSLLIRLLANGSTVRYRFPTTVVAGDTVVTARNVFPLALNDSRAILRGDFTVGTVNYNMRLMSCILNPAALDPGTDGTVDCTGGMTVIGGINGSVRVGTVLDFSLNNAGLLAGNRAYNVAGTGTPFVLDVTAASPVAVQLASLATGTDYWEINAITDLNQAGRMVGYGYRNCSTQAEAFFIDRTNTAPASALRFGFGTFENPARYVVSRRGLRIAPTVTGGSGNYEFRVSTRTPTDAAWTLLADWSATAPTYDPGTYRGDVCFRIEARDAAARAAVQQTVVRYAISDGRNGRMRTADDVVPVDATTGTAAGAGGAVLLALLSLLGLRRRRH